MAYEKEKRRRLRARYTPGEQAQRSLPVDAVIWQIKS